MKKLQKRILVAPLNWGLGHATRCIPIIKALIKHNFIPVLASDGSALELLKKEFPQLEAIEFPSYHISYSKKGKNLKLKLLKNSPKMLKAIKSERALVKNLVKKRQIDGIISDNRIGVYSKKVPSVFMTHQLKVMSGATTWLTTKMHEKVISKFKECWIPDNSGNSNLSGELSHVNSLETSVKYIGPISRFTKEEMPNKYDLLVLLSGPEPQRTLLEELLLKELKSYKRKVLFVKGIVQKQQIVVEQENMTIYNYMTSQQLHKALNESKLILSRSGYTTIMDLAAIGKKAFFIPTPGQFEQEYLAKRLSELQLVPSCNQEDFTIDRLQEVDSFKGLQGFDYKLNYKKLFDLF